MPSIAELVDASEANRPTYLQKAAWSSEAAFASLLFCWAAMQFKANPSKGRALFIWTKFLQGIYSVAANGELRQGGAAGVGILDALPTELDLTLMELSQAEYRAIRFWANFAAEQQLAAARMSRLVRFFTSSDRAVPGTLFDNVVENFRTQLNNNQLHELSSAYAGLSGYRESTFRTRLRNKLAALSKDFKDCGFDPAKLGLSGISA